MSQAGILTEDDRVELIEGELIAMAPVGDRHAGTTARLNRSRTSPCSVRDRMTTRAATRGRTTCFCCCCWRSPTPACGSTGR